MKNPPLFMWVNVNYSNRSRRLGQLQLLPLVHNPLLRQAFPSSLNAPSP